MYFYAHLLLLDKGIEQNKKEAAKLYKYVTYQDYSGACYEYARIFNKVDGIEINKEEAKKYIYIYKISGS